MENICFSLQVDGFSYTSEEVEALRNKRIEEETESFVFEESGNEHSDKPDKRVSVGLDEDLTLTGDKSNLSKGDTVQQESTV